MLRVSSLAGETLASFSADELEGSSTPAELPGGFFANSASLVFWRPGLHPSKKGLNKTKTKRLIAYITRETDFEFRRCVRSY